MTASLPPEVQRVFDSFVTSEFTTIDREGHPVSWPVTPFYRPGDPCIDVTTGVGYPRKSEHALANPKVALLFSDPSGSGMQDAPQVLVQGTAQVDDRDLEQNRERYRREAAEKLPAGGRLRPPKPLRRFFDWQDAQIYVHVRPERVYAWPRGDPTEEPQLFDAHMEEVRSGHDEEPPGEHVPAEGGATAWDDRVTQLGRRCTTAVLSLIAPDGFPFSLRVPIAVDENAKLIRLGAGALGVPVQPGLACITAHEHHRRFHFHPTFQVRGDLVEADGGWALAPHALVGSLESPPQSSLQGYRIRIGRMLRYRRRAKRELRGRGR
jgi:hypothetical protein